MLSTKKSIGILLYLLMDNSIDLLHPLIACTCNALFVLDDSILFTPHNCL